MRDQASTNPLLWVTGDAPREQAKDSAGHKHEKLKSTWQRMQRWAVRRLGDESKAEEALQEATLRVAKASHATSIVEPDAYVAKAVARSVTKFLVTEEPVDFVGTAGDVETVMGIPEKDWVKELEDRVFMEEFLAAMDEESRAICHKWLRGDEWKEIAGDLGCSVQHAKDKLRHAIESTKKRLLGPGRSNR
jgi:DNA-directed RNA polymerase specialized sigma24 family protein